jgi:hypothetical protein
MTHVSTAFQVTPENVTHVLALSDERDQHENRLQTETQAAYRAGYRAALADIARREDADWAATARRSPVGSGPDLAELEQLRWGPGGRAGAMLPLGAISPAGIAPAQTTKAHRAEAA